MRNRIWCPPGAFQATGCVPRLPGYQPGGHFPLSRPVTLGHNLSRVVRDIMKPSPAFQFYPADYLSDANVDMMTLAEQGAYMRLLCHAWKSTVVGRLPNEPETLALLSRAGKDWSSMAPAILRAFKTTEDGKMIYSKRLIEEWKKQQAFRQQRVMAGKRSASIRSTTVQRPFNEKPTSIPTLVERDGNSLSSSSSSDIVCVESPVELPRGFPKTEQEAKFAAEKIGCPPEFAVKLWNLAVSRGGVDSKDRQIRNWQNHVAFSWQCDRENQAKQKANPNFRPTEEDQHRTFLKTKLDDAIREADALICRTKKT